MRVVHIVPGSGDSFYCQNCLRDKGLMKALHLAGVEVVLVPMYLPLDVLDQGAVPDGVQATPVFFGAINTYLAHLVPGYGRLPKGLTRWLDSTPVMRWAARRAGSTRASGMEEMTLATLEGRGAHHQRELRELIDWFGEWGMPDIIHLSNGLLLGLAEPLGKLGVRICCSLQDENDWIDRMSSPYAEKIWNRMAQCGAHVDAFTAVSYRCALILERYSA